MATATGEWAAIGYRLYRVGAVQQFTPGPAMRLQAEWAAHSVQVLLSLVCVTLTHVSLITCVKPTPAAYSTQGEKGEGRRAWHSRGGAGTGHNTLSIRRQRALAATVWPPRARPSRPSPGPVLPPSALSWSRSAVCTGLGQLSLSLTCAAPRSRPLAHRCVMTAAKLRQRTGDGAVDEVAAALLDLLPEVVGAALAQVALHPVEPQVRHQPTTWTIDSHAQGHSIEP